MSCSPDVWEGWWLQYGLDNTLFTLFLGGDRALAVDHREKGLHTGGDQGQLCEAVEVWDDAWEVGNLPMNLQRWDVAMEEISQLKYFGMKLGKKFGMAKLKNRLDFYLTALSIVDVGSKGKDVRL